VVDGGKLSSTTLTTATTATTTTTTTTITTRRRYHEYNNNHIINNGVVELPAMRLSFMPNLSGFSLAKKEFGRMIVEDGNAELKEIWNGHPDAVEAFRAIFPEIVESRGITKLRDMNDDDDHFRRWDRTNDNEIVIEMEKSKKTNEEEEGIDRYPFVAIGGPSTYAAMLLFKLRHPEKKAIHIVTDRFDSNHDGSAYYYHERDAMPVYVNKVNRGPYCVYIDLRKRCMSPHRLLHLSISDRHHVKISLSWANINISKLFTIFLPNVYHMLLDLYLLPKSSSPLSNIVRHASSTRQIISTISSSLSSSSSSPLPSAAASLSAATAATVATVASASASASFSSSSSLSVKQLLLLHRAEGACYVGLAGEGGNNPETHFKWLNQFAHIPFLRITPKGYPYSLILPTIDYLSPSSTYLSHTQ